MAYGTFKREADAVICIKKLDGSVVDGHTIKAWSFYEVGTGSTRSSAKQGEGWMQGLFN